MQNKNIKEMALIQDDNENHEVVDIETRKIMDKSAAHDIVINQLFLIPGALECIPEHKTPNFKLALLIDVGDLKEALNAGDEQMMPHFTYSSLGHKLNPVPILFLSGNRAYFNNLRKLSGEKDIGWGWCPSHKVARTYLSRLN